MFHKLLKQKYEYLTNYFETELRNEGNRTPQSIIFYGLDPMAQYVLAQNIAKILNCKHCRVGIPAHRNNYECDCLNCRWIRDNQHPAVMTISRVDNKPPDDKTTTVISVEQSRMIKNSIVNTSEYHRVFIFTDVETEELSEFQKKSLEEFESTGFKLPQTGKNWYPMPLNQASLQDAAANALLKSIEEPPAGVTFIFLTRDKEDMISTIVSRSQCFHVPALSREICDDEFIRAKFAGYPNFNIKNSMTLAAEICAYMGEKGVSAEYILCAIQNYLQSMMVGNCPPYSTNPANKALLHKVKSDISHLTEAQNQLRASVKELNVFESLFMKLGMRNEE